MDGSFVKAFFRFSFHVEFLMMTIAVATAMIIYLAAGWIQQLVTLKRTVIKSGGTHTHVVVLIMQWCFSFKKPR